MTSAFAFLVLTGYMPMALADPALSSDELKFITALANPNVPGVYGLLPEPILPAQGSDGRSLARLGHTVANDVRHGVHPLDEQAWLQRKYTPLSLACVSDRRCEGLQWSWLVTNAVRIFAPEFSRYYWTTGTWPAGAVMTAWNTPGIPPLINRPQ